MRGVDEGRTSRRRASTLACLVGGGLLAVAVFGQSGCERQESIGFAQQPVLGCMSEEIVLSRTAKSWLWLDVDEGEDITDALQQALDQAAAGGITNVVIPEGEYYLSQTVRIHDAVGVGLFGGPNADGSSVVRTSLVWAGDEGGTMFFVDQVSGFRLARLKLNGSDGAETAIRAFDSNNGGPPSPASYYHEYTDLTVEGFQVGIFIGQYRYDRAADTNVEVPLVVDGYRYRNSGSNEGDSVIRRCHFEGLGEQAVVISGQNSIDWSIESSSFSYVPVAVYVEGGMAALLGNRFRGSTHSDVVSSGAGGLLLRENDSTHGARFLYTKRESGTNQVLIGNRIDTRLAPQPAAAAIETGAQSVILLDNQIAAGGVGKPILLPPGDPYWGPRDVVTGGNRTLQQMALTGARWVQVAPDQVVSVLKFIPRALPPPATVRLPSHEFHASPAGDCCTDQACGECAAMVAAAPVGSTIHLEAGTYRLEYGIDLGSASRKVLAGDGVRTVLFWEGGTSQSPMVGAAVYPQVAVQDMRLLIGALASHGVAPGVEFVAAVDSSQSRALVDQVVIGGAEAAVMVSGFDGLTTVLDTSPVTNNEVGVMVVGTGNATSSGGVRAFGGGMSSSFEQMVEVAAYGRLAVQGADVEGYSQQAVFDSAARFTLVGGRVAGGGADCLECVLGVPAPGVPDRGNFSFGPGFAGHAVLAGVDVWGRVESTDATAPVLALGVTNYYGQRANDACQEPCGILPWMGPETTVAVQASVCNPNGLGLFGVPDPISEECPFISPGSGTYSYNGRVRHPGSACSHAGACQDHAATTSLSHEPLLADLRGASFVEPLQRTSCGTMDVAVRRVHIGVLPSPADWRLMPAGVRLVRQ